MVGSSGGSALGPILLWGPPTYLDFIFGRPRACARAGNGIRCFLRAGTPTSEAWAHPITILNGQAGALCNVQAQGGAFSPNVKTLKLTAEALQQQFPAGIEFWVSTTGDQHSAGMVDTVEMTALAQTDSLYVDAM